MAKYLKIVHPIMVFVGFILSPISWWNDLLVNIPISIFLALPFKIFGSTIFYVAIIVIYWITNIVGLVMMHFGILKTFSKKRLTKRDIATNLVFCFGYTAIILGLISFKILNIPEIRV